MDGFFFLSVKNEKIKLKNEENLINFRLDLSILFHYLVYKTINIFHHILKESQSSSFATYTRDPLSQFSWKESPYFSIRFSSNLLMNLFTRERCQKDLGIWDTPARQPREKRAIALRRDWHASCLADICCDIMRIMYLASSSTYRIGLSKLDFLNITLPTDASRSLCTQIISNLMKFLNLIKNRFIFQALSAFTMGNE